MGRPRSFDNIAALEAAMKAFWLKGYEATSFDDLEKAMGLRRTSIYNAYGNKRKLFQSALEHYSNQVLTKWMDALDSNDDVQKAIKNLMRGALELDFGPDTPRGCLIGLTALESEQHDAKTLQIVEAFFRRLNRGVEQYFKRAKDRGALSTTIDEKELAAVVSSMIPGLVTRARSNAPETVISRAIDGIMRLV